MTKLLDVNVTIGQLNPDTNNSYNATFAPADTANSNLVLPEGTLNLQSVEEDVLIRWTLVAGTTHQFWTANSAPSGATDAGWNETQPNWAFQWRPKNPGNPGQEPNSGWTTSSVTSSVVTVADANPSSASPTPFEYRLWLSDGKFVDPSIINR